MLMYTPTKSPQALTILFQIELFKSSGDFLFHITIYKAEKIYFFSNIVQPWYTLCYKMFYFTFYLMNTAF